ncbi:hypothetical protein MTR_2g050270 [Medicago truncatula]|uniref:Uncharacterized protein n=1 Tax=Medicago truncatula TaxID=3880 RepID=A0A072V8K1_MEDTR|nr:hypothetical protein MTR_2g050270 [Medicago truncatula]
MKKHSQGISPQQFMSMQWTQLCVYQHTTSSTTTATWTTTTTTQQCIFKYDVHLNMVLAMASDLAREASDELAYSPGESAYSRWRIASGQTT